MHRLATVHTHDNQPTNQPTTNQPTTNDVTTQPISISALKLKQNGNKGDILGLKDECYAPGGQWSSA